MNTCIQNLKSRHMLGYFLNNKTAVQEVYWLLETIATAHKITSSELSFGSHTKQNHNNQKAGDSLFTTDEWLQLYLPSSG